MRPTAELEALLFQYGEPVSLKVLAHLMGTDAGATEKLLAEYGESLKDDARGLSLVQSGDTYQLATKQEAAPLVEKLAKENFGTELTPAVLEVTTIVAYLGPVPRITIDEIRGVNSSLALRNAYIRGLLEKKREKNGYTYSLSTEFLRHLGIKAVGELPQYETHRQRLEEILKQHE